MPSRIGDLFYKSCVTDKPITSVVAALKAHVAGGQQGGNMVGARSDEVQAETLDWLSENGIDPNLLTHMRRANDYLPDDELKRNWLHACDARPGCGL